MTEENRSRENKAGQGKHYVYIVRCADGSLYTGYARNVEARIAVHNAGKGSRYTRARLPVALLASWEFEEKRDALQAEYAIKQLPGAQKLRLLERAKSQGAHLFPWESKKMGPG